MTGCEGQDWASYQSATPSTTGLAFAAVKATESTTYTNSRYTAQVAHARAAGLLVIHYHFARPGSMLAQVAYFLKQAQVKPTDVLCLDWEDAGVSGADKDSWLKAVQKQAPGHRVILYCNRDFWLNRDTTSFAGDGLWIADPSAAKGSPRITAPWLIHQYSSAGGIDRDYSHLTGAQLKTWAASTTPTPTPEDDVALTADDKTWLASAIKTASFSGVWATDAIKAPADAPDIKTNPTWQAQSVLTDIQAHVRAAAPVTLTDDQLAALAAKVAPVVAEQLAELLAARLQS